MDNGTGQSGSARMRVGRAAGAWLGVAVAALGLAWATAAWAGGSSPLTATPQEKKQAQAQYEEGTKAFEGRRFADALKAFQGSYDVVASPNSHLMMARSMRELGQLAAAYDELERTEQEAKQLSQSDAAKYGPTIDKAVADREALRKRVALVTVRVRGEGVSVSVGGRAVAGDRVGRPMAVMPGPFEIAGSTADGRRVAKSATATAGGTLEIEIDLSQPAAAPTPTPVPAPAPAPAPGPAPDAPAKGKGSLLPYALIAGGVGVAGLGLGTAFGLMHLSTYSDIEDKCPQARRPCNDLQDDIDKGKSQQTIANVGFVVGGVGLGIGAALLVLDLSRGGSKEAKEGAATPAISVGYRTVEVTGRF